MKKGVKKRNDTCHWASRCSSKPPVEPWPLRQTATAAVMPHRLGNRKATSKDANIQWVFKISWFLQIHIVPLISQHFSFILDILGGAIFFFFKWKNINTFLIKIKVSLSLTHLSYTPGQVPFPAGSGWRLEAESICGDSGQCLFHSKSWENDN